MDRGIYRSTLRIQAIQWDGYNLRNVTLFLAGQAKRVAFDETQNDLMTVENIDGQRFSVPKSNYIIVPDSGGWWQMPSEVFEAQFEREG